MAARGSGGATLARVARQAARHLPLQRLRALRLRSHARRLLFDWNTVLGRGFRGESWQSVAARAQADGGHKSVLFATTTGIHLAAIQFDAVLAAALTLRGRKVSFLLCDAALPACMIDQHDWHPNRRAFANGNGPRPVCSACAPTGENYLRPFGLPIHRLGTLLNAGDRIEAERATRDVNAANVGNWTFRGLHVGEHALAGALRFHARSDLDHVPYADGVVRRFADAGALAAIAGKRLLERLRPDVLVAHHGIYQPQGVWVEAGRQAGVGVVTWNPAYRQGSFLLSHGDTYHKTMITEDPGLWRDAPLSGAEEQTLDTYLNDRRQGTTDWITFGSGRKDEFTACLDQLGLDAARPTVLLLTSVAWDAQLHYESNAFRDQTEWVDATIDAFKEQSGLNLVIRIHPAELTGFIRSEQKLADHIARRHGTLPPHIAVVGPENPMNTYALADGCDAALIYSTKTGIELAARGKPVVVAGEAWIRGKRFSRDARSPAEYRAILAELPFGGPIPPQARELARRYAYHFFFRRMVALPGFEARKGWPPYRARIETLEELAPGASANLDMVCERILSGEPFVAPDAG